MIRLRGCTGWFALLLFAFGKYIFSTHCLIKLAWSFLAVHFKIALINLYMLSAPTHHYQLDESVSSFYSVWWTIFILFPIKIPVSKQCRPWSDTLFCGVWSTPCSVASDRGLFCLPMSLLWDATIYVFVIEKHLISTFRWTQTTYWVVLTPVSLIENGKV